MRDLIIETQKFVKSNRLILFLSLLGVSLLCGIISLYWQFWLLLGIIVYMACIVYFSKEIYGLLNIHIAALSLLVLHALPSTILILEGEINLDSQESLMLFSSITIGLTGYTFGALLFKKLFPLERRNNSQLSKNLNTLFWFAYKYRYLLTFISIIVFFYRGYMPYEESIVYRIETPGAIRYLISLISLVFSVLIVTMISIIGDFRKHKKLSLFSYLCIILTILSIIAGHRIWIIALFVCLILVFQPYLKRRHMLIIIVLAAFMFFVISGAVRYARQGSSLTENINYFYKYLSNIKNINFTGIVWGFSDFTIPFSTFITLVKNIPQNIGFDYSAPIKDLSLFIPTIIYPERPLPYNQWFVKVFYPEIFARGGGLTFYIIGFGYLFAGPVGVFIYLFMFGVLFEWFNKFLRTVEGPASLFLYSYFFIELFSFVRGCGFVFFIKLFFMAFIIPLSLLFLTILILEDLFNLKRRYKTAK